MGRRRLYFYSILSLWRFLFIFFVASPKLIETSAGKYPSSLRNHFSAINLIKVDELTSFLFHCSHEIIISSSSSSSSSFFLISHFLCCNIMAVLIGLGPLANCSGCRLFVYQLWTMLHLISLQYLLAVKNFIIIVGNLRQKSSII